MKRADLATPSGVDHDYNYLTSIEREFDKAERKANSRGILILENEGRKDRPIKGLASLKAGLERSEVVVARAPTGMSRSKSNGTKWLKGSRCLEWTVEWVHPDGKKDLWPCTETLPILTAYKSLESYKAKARDGPNANHRKAKKRKKSSVDSSNEKILSPSNNTTDQNPVGSSIWQGGEKSKKWTMFDDHGAREAENVIRDENATKEGSHSVDQVHPLSANGICKTQDINGISTVNSILSNHSHEIHRSTSTTEAKLSFYLHTPSLPSRHIVLAPIDTDATLSKTLSHRLVLEYPTIYVFDQITEGKPPEGFITEEEYYRTARKEIIQELEGGEVPDEGPAGGRDQGSEMGLGQVDEKKLLEVLERDFAG